MGDVVRTQQGDGLVPEIQLDADAQLGKIAEKSPVEPQRVQHAQFGRRAKIEGLDLGAGAGLDLDKT